MLKEDLWARAYGVIIDANPMAAHSWNLSSIAVPVESLSCDHAQ